MLTKLLIRKPEGRCNGEDNIRIDVKEIWCDDAEWIHLATEVFWVITACGIVSRYKRFGGT
jgi:hypothetical protein